MGCPPPPPKKVADVAPELTRVSKPYPTGVVILELAISEQGVPVSSCVLRGIRSDFDEAAQEATLRWRFAPYLLHGKRVPVALTVTVATGRPDR